MVGKKDAWHHRRQPAPHQIVDACETDCLLYAFVYEDRDHGDPQDGVKVGITKFTTALPQFMTMANTVLS